MSEAPLCLESGKGQEAGAVLHITEQQLDLAEPAAIFSLSISISNLRVSCSSLRVSCLSCCSLPAQGVQRYSGRTWPLPTCQIAVFVNFEASSCTRSVL
jgi:hypothetical protein